MASKDPIIKAAEDWLNDNPGKKLSDYYKATNYDGPKLKTKQRAGQPAKVGYRTAASTEGPRAKRKAAIKEQETKYIDTWKKAGFSETQAMEALRQSLQKTKNIEQQRTKLNKEKGKNVFTLGHETAAMEGGGDFGRNVRLERGLGPGGNYSRGSKDEIPDSVKPAMGIPRSGRGGQDAAIMDMNPDLFDLGLTPKDKQEIRRNPSKANDIIQRRQNKLKKLRIGKGVATWVPQQDWVENMATPKKIDTDPLGGMGPLMGGV